MDTWTPKVDEKEVSAKLELIKNCMPSTYKAVQAKAGKVGGFAYELVRRALRGEADCFFAIEAGHVMGTVFNSRDIMADTALSVVEFPNDAVVLWSANVYDDWQCDKCRVWIKRTAAVHACATVKVA